MDVYDLDGTILRGNSFTRFVAYLFVRSIARLDLSTTIRLVANVVLRKARKITHYELKQRTVRLAARLSDDEMQRFVSKIAADCQVRLSALRRQFGHAPCSVLATAAPGLYALALGERLGFDHVIASDHVASNYVETIRERKRDRVLALASRLGRPVGTLFTDHLDDITLALEAARIVAVDASPEFLEALASAGKRTVRVDFR